MRGLAAPHLPDPHHPRHRNLRPDHARQALENTVRVRGQRLERRLVVDLREDQVVRGRPHRDRDDLAALARDREVRSLAVDAGVDP